jgi:hypothetical protein
MDRPYPTCLAFTPTPLEVAQSSLVALIIFNVFWYHETALLHTLKISSILVDIIGLDSLIGLDGLIGLAPSASRALSAALALLASSASLGADGLIGLNGLIGLDPIGLKSIVNRTGPIGLINLVGR